VSQELAGQYSRAGIAGPRAAPDPERVWCVAAGRLEGVAELGAELGIDPKEPVEIVLAAAYEERGAEMLDRLGGSFALLVWDGLRRRGILAVDQLGSRSLFFHESGGYLTFATEVGDLLRLLSTGPGPDEGAVVRWLVSGTLEPGETLFAGVRRLAGGCHLRLADGGWSEHRHWRPRFTTPREITLEEAAAAVRGELERSIVRRCADRPAGVLLSGGLDSTSVASVAAASGCATSLRSYSALFPHDAAADESEFVDLAVRSLALPSSRYEATAKGVLAASAEHVGEWRLPAASPTLFFQRPILERARVEGAELILDGQGGDELFGNSPYLLGDLLRRLRLGALRRRWRELDGDAQTTRETFRTYALGGAAPVWLVKARRRLRRVPTPPWLTPRAAVIVGDVPDRPAWRRLEGPRWWAWLTDSLTAGRERMGVHDHLRRKLRSQGLTGAHPLLDDLGLIELVLSLPPELAYDLELDRPLLRRAMKGLVPEPIRLRRTKSLFNTLVVEALSGPDRPVLTDLLEPRDAEIRAYVTEDRLRTVVHGPRAGDNKYPWAWNAWRLASTELWLRSLKTDEPVASQVTQAVSV
jgi:asparagine synthase (glutamine-hydrolysing)